MYKIICEFKWNFYYLVSDGRPAGAYEVCWTQPDFHIRSIVAKYLINCRCSYKLRIESMLLKEEFASNMSYLEPSINAMIVAGEGK